MVNDEKNKYDEILSQLVSCLKRPNAGLIKISTRDGNTVVGQYEEGEFSLLKGGRFITLSNGKNIHYSEVVKIE